MTSPEAIARRLIGVPNSAQRNFGSPRAATATEAIGKTPVRQGRFPAEGGQAGSPTREAFVSFVLHGNDQIFFLKHLPDCMIYVRCKNTFRGKKY